MTSQIGVLKSAKKFALNAIFRVASCIYYIMTSHVQFGWKIPPTAIVGLPLLRGVTD